MNNNPGIAEQLKITAKIAVIIALVEFVIMLGLEVHAGHLSSFQQALVDALVVVILGTPLIYLIVIRPFVLARNDALNQSTHLALSDPLTGLGNRRYLEQFSSAVLAQIRRQRTFGALFYIDLDGFKPVNDQYGHEVGDLVLIEIARRIRDCVRDSDITCRMGGDEFLVLVAQAGADFEKARDGVESVASKLVDAVSAPVNLDSNVVRVGCSIGTRLLDGHTHSIDKALREADLAMYQAKSSAKGRAIHYEDLHHQWYSDRSVGIRDIDREHREIDQLFKKLGSHKVIDSDDIRSVISLLEQHFNTEERLARQLGLNFPKAHLQQHQGILDVLNRMLQSSAKSELSAVLVKAENLVASHISQFDLDLSVKATKSN